MPEASEIESIIQRAVTEVIDAALPGLRSEIVSRATAAVQALAPAAGSSPTELLSAAATSIQESSGQADILRRLLDGGSHFAPRIALFVVKLGSIVGWQAVGFEDNEAAKAVTLSGDRGLVADAVQGRVPASGSTADFDISFISAVKPPASDECLVLPLIVKEKVAALIYADGGTRAGTKFDASALSVLTRFAALWLETTSVRKSVASAPEEAPQPVAAAAGAGEASPSSALAATADEADLHKKARRFAKLLVEEIMLYNQAKVVEGKQNQDLYTRLRNDIEKSRATYDKRYGESQVASADYFNQELVRILADNNVTLMGDGFPR
jgi:hypothetical protein